MRAEAGSLEIGILSTPGRGARFGCTFPSLDGLSRELFYFERGVASLVAVAHSGLTGAGTFSVAKVCLADLEKFRRNFPYFLTMRECGSATQPLLRACASFQVAMKGSGFDDPSLTAMCNWLDSFALLSALKGAEIFVAENGSLAFEVYRSFESSLSPFDEGALLRLLTMIPLIEEIPRALAEFTFECPQEEERLKEICFVPVNVDSIKDYIDVLVAANERQNRVFDDQDFDLARKEMNFSLLPNLFPLAPESGPFLRVDGWLVTAEGRAIGVIGLAVFQQAFPGIWITWYATRPGLLRMGSHLMALALSVAKSRGNLASGVWTSRSAGATIRRYETFGFEQSNRNPPDCAEDHGEVVALERLLDDIIPGYPRTISLV